MISPPANSAYHLSAAFDASAQSILLEAIGEPGLREVTLWVDGMLIARFTSAPYHAWWALQAGVHQAWAEARRENGERVRSEVVTFTVE